jgi:hypothetical protein
VSQRPHEHYLLDEVARSLWAVVCATCEQQSEGEGLVALIESPLDYQPVASFHWREVYERGARATT